MTRQRIYLDFNATAPLRTQVREVMLTALDAANPSSVHLEGRAARQIVEKARRQVSVLVNAKSEHVFFTSGATEAASMVMTSDWQMGRSPLKYSRAYISATEHPCILSGGRFDPVALDKIAVKPDGILDLQALDNALANHDKNSGLPLVAVHAANNETGIIQPLEEIGRIVRSHGGLFIVDAVQAAGRVPLDIAAGYADFFILSSHKLGGPKGAGALVASSDLLMPLALIKGGGQEKSHRAGTENVPGIVGFGMAAELTLIEMASLGAILSRRNQVEKLIRKHVSDAVIHGDSAPRLPNTVFFTIPGVKAETAQIAFDLAGIALSAGSACSSGKVGASHVLTAMGVDNRWGALRISIGATTTEMEIEQFGVALQAFMIRGKLAAAS